MNLKTSIKMIMSIVSLSAFPLVLDFWASVSEGALWGLSGFIATMAIGAVVNALVWDQW